MIKKLLEPFGFSFGQLQDIATLIKQLEKNYIPVIKFVEYIEEKKIEKVKANKDAIEKMKQDKIKWEQNALKCPECTTITMNLYPVNTHPGDQTGDNSKSQWVCPKCWHEEYSTATIEKWLKGMEEKFSVRVAILKG